MNTSDNMLIENQMQNQTKTQYKNLIKKLNNESIANISNIYDEYSDVFCDVFINGNLNTNDLNVDRGVKLDLIGLYYLLITKDYQSAYNAWMESIDNYENSNAMNNMGCYFLDLGIKYENATNESSPDLKLKYLATGLLIPQDERVITYQCYDICEYYFTMGFNKGSVPAINNLGYFYLNVKKNHERGKNFLLMAIERGSITALCHLGNYYCFDVKDYEQGKHYLTMAIDNEIVYAMRLLGIHYNRNEKNYEQAMKYFMMGWSHGDKSSLEYLALLGNCNECLPYKKLTVIYQTIGLSNDEKCTKLLSNANNGFIKWITFLKLQEKGNVLSDCVISIMNFLKTAPETKSDIQLFKNRKFRAQKYQTFDDCPVCHDENVLNIDLGCGHGVCDNCYRPSTCIYNWCTGK